MKTEYRMVLDDGSEIELDLDGNLYDLDIDESINPGEPSEGQNYNNLRNKPQINSVELIGNINLPKLNLRSIFYKTTAEWNSNPLTISEEGAIYIYSDYKNNNDINIPGIKIGDGLAYIIDLPFIADASAEAITNITSILNDHITSTEAHITSTDRDFWNNKVTASLSEATPEELILSKL